MSNTEEERIADFLKSLAETQSEIRPETTPKVERIKAVEVVSQPDNNTMDPKDSVTEPLHYKNLAIDTLELMSVNFSDEAYMGFLEGNVLKYVMRYKMKNGMQDLRKAQYYLELLINRQEMREKNQNK